MFMRSLILHPTSTAQWLGLIHEAQHTLSIRLHEEIESYLVFLLMRFADEPNVVQSVLGLDFLESTQKLSRNQPDQLRSVGDKCLLFAGLFPDRAQKRQVTPEYFVQLGKTAYFNVAAHTVMEKQAELFVELCQKFLTLTDILQATRHISQSQQNLLKEIERWHSTGSRLSWQKIKQTTESTPVSDPSKKSVH